MCEERLFCLTLAGFDPTAGAGVLADVKTFESLNVYGMGVLTANTTQTDDHFLGVEWVNPDLIEHQLQVLFARYNFPVVKIGIVESYAIFRRLVTCIKKLNADVKIVWDPVLKSTSGYQFYTSGMENVAFAEDECFLITPNLNESRIIWNDRISDSQFETRKAAVLVKGGHDELNKGCDTLFYKGNIFQIPGESFHGRTKHGTGCVLSSAIAAYLIRGFSLVESCKLGKIYVEKFILSNHTNLGYHHETSMTK